MGDETNIAGQWVEVAEEAEEGQFVLLRPDAGVPPSRGSRRHLELADQGRASAMGQGAADRLESVGGGGWALEDGTLTLTLPGWEGTYDVETIDEGRLILRRR